jgi:hypothetical protein
MRAETGIPFSTRNTLYRPFETIAISLGTNPRHSCWRRIRPESVSNHDNKFAEMASSGQRCKGRSCR